MTTLIISPVRFIRSWIGIGIGLYWFGVWFIVPAVLIGLHLKVNGKEY